MILTNELNLPQALVDAVKNDPYDSGGAWRSVTQLISPPRLIVLKKKHEHEIKEDVADRLYALYGQIVHGILERANRDNLVEKRLFMEVLGKKISGQFDTLIVKDGELSDWKFSTVWKAKELSEDWLWQMNLLAVLFRANGTEIKKAKIVLLMRDHSKPKAKREGDYPQFPVMVHQVPLWSPESQMSFLEERVQLHLDAETKLPQCTDAEKWQRKTVYAVMKHGAKRAAKLYDDEFFATQHALERPGEFYVVERPGEPIRCNDYCPSSKFCEQFICTQHRDFSEPQDML